MPAMSASVYTKMEIKCTTKHKSRKVAGQPKSCRIYIDIDNFTVSSQLKTPFPNGESNRRQDYNPPDKQANSTTANLSRLQLYNQKKWKWWQLEESFKRHHHPLHLQQPHIRYPIHPEGSLCSFSLKRWWVNSTVSRLGSPINQQGMNLSLF